MADGRILHVGGSYVNYVNVFDPILPVGSQWNNPPAPDMMFDRWYPTSTTLADGRVLVTSGWRCSPYHTGNPTSCDPGENPFVRTPELYDPATNTWDLLWVADREQWIYPFMFVLPDGRIVDAGPRDTSFLDPATWTWSGSIPDPTYPNPLPLPPGEHGSAVMYEPGKIMRCGGSERLVRAVATTWVVDLNNDGVGWLNAEPMNKKRRNHNLVVLPDGKVLAVGGNELDLAGGVGSVDAVLEAEIFDPASGKWTLQPPSHPDHPRMYHSTAMLLPDGRVVSAGGNTYPTAQIFKPPYITSGAPRPIITFADLYMQYGQTYTVQYNQNGGPVVTRACLIRLASVTHGFDQDQRRVPLGISTETPPGTLDITAPADANIAPPGFYMLFILNEYAANQFAPCEMAAYVQIGP
ncbi:MAG: DUF1929 domain-containing protein [Planctomycetes bacterium]|nr:DUF1929 domain-containing protein [Planctomycetota bacterium]